MHCLSQAHVKPLVGFQAPDFTAEAVFDQEFIKVQLSKYRGKCVLDSAARALFRRFVCVCSHGSDAQASRYVVLFFYPLDFTFVCPTEMY